MSNLLPNQLFHAWFERGWNQGDESAIDEYFSKTFTMVDLPSADGKPLDREGFKLFFRNFRSAIPDVHVTIHRTITEGQFCAIYCEVTGTHTGQGLGIAPTGLKVHFMGMSWARTENGQFQEGNNCFDFLTMYQQLGIVPAT